MQKVLIPLNPDKPSPDKKITSFIVRETYLKKLEKYNLVPVFVSYIENSERINRLYADCGGVMFMGGVDFNPKFYEEEPHPKTYGINQDFDNLELRILEKVLQDKKPFLGICRGSQALALAAGGSLYQHLPDAFPDEKHESASYEEITTNPKHEVILDKNSKIYKIIGKEKIFTNSGHHQGVKNPGMGIKISGKTPAGVVEIIEHEDPNFFCFGVQSHPELEENGPLEKIFEWFARSIN